jgi:hypothetical protein
LGQRFELVDSSVTISSLYARFELEKIVPNYADVGGTSSVMSKVVTQSANVETVGVKRALKISASLPSLSSFGLSL